MPALHGEVKRYRSSGVCAIHLFPQPLFEMLDLLSAYSRPTLIVAQVDYALHGLNRKAERSLSLLAHTLKIPHYASEKDES